MKRHAFTLVELLVVIAIIGLLTSVAVISTTSARSKARDTKWLADKNQIEKALTLYYNDNGVWPPTSGLTCFGAPSSEGCWKGAYIGSDSLVSAMSSYMTVFPKTGSETGVYATDRFLYVSNMTLSGQTGAWVVWPKENTMTAADCPAVYIYHYDKYWYCYDYLGQ